MTREDDYRRKREQFAAHLITLINDIDPDGQMRPEDLADALVERVAPQGVTLNIGHVTYALNRWGAHRWDADLDAAARFIATETELLPPDTQ